MAYMQISAFSPRATADLRGCRALLRGAQKRSRAVIAMTRMVTAHLEVSETEF
jgi:hypothetical protein